MRVCVNQAYAENHFYIKCKSTQFYFIYFKQGEEKEKKTSTEDVKQEPCEEPAAKGNPRLYRWHRTITVVFHTSYQLSFFLFTFIVRTITDVHSKEKKTSTCAVVGNYSAMT